MEVRSDEQREATENQVDDSCDSFIFPRARTRRPSRLVVEEAVTAASAHAHESGRVDGSEEDASVSRSLAGLYFSTSRDQEATMQPDDMTNEVDDLYCELLYSLVHSVGSSEVLEHVDDLHGYLRACFRLDEVKHQELLDRVHQRSRPPVTLNVNVIEARDLIGKDVSGLSDPYCTVSVSSCADEHENTSVKQQTLSPVWNETLHLDVADVDEDQLNVQVWDFDADESVKAKMYQVKGYRGFGKFLKEITASSKAGQSAPEFLGQVSLPLKEVPLSGLERWFPLEARDAAQAKERGEIRLGLSLSIQQDESSFMERYRKYERSLRVLFEYELGRNQAWRGQICKWAFIILRQFAAHQGLRREAANVCLWSFYSDALARRTLDFSFVHKVLELVDQSTDPLAEELDSIYWNSAVKFIGAALNVVRNVRTNQQLKDDTPNLVALLQCLKHLETKGQTRGDFPNLIDRLQEELNAGAVDWWEHLTNDGDMGDADDERLESAIDICHQVIADVETLLTWQKEAFDKIFQMTCLPAIYRYYDVQLTALCKPLVDSITDASKSESLSESTVISETVQACGFDPNGQGPVNAAANPMMTMRTALFELYLALQKYHRMSSSLPPSDEPLHLKESYLWFSTAVSCWFDMALFKAMIRIGKAIHIDSFAPIDTIARHSSSAVDTVSVFYQVKIFWDQLCWPDPDSAIAMVLKILDDISRCSIFYAETLCLKLEKLNLKQTGDVFNVNQAICVVINDIAHVQKSIQPLSERLGVQKLIHLLQECNSDAAQVLDKARLTLAESITDNINAKMEEIFSCISERMEVEVNKMVDSKADHAELEDEMINYLDGNLQTLNCQLDSAVFDRLLEIICQRIMHVFHSTICKDIEKQHEPSHFLRWNDLVSATVKFFFGVECHERDDEILIRVLGLLKLHGSDSDHLMRLYLLERKNHVGDDQGLGTLAVRALFVGETLTVEVIDARSLKKMDVGGLADPYVKVELLMPKTLPAAQKTKIQKNTLTPIFDETFTFQVPVEFQTRSDCMILLTVKDHDLVGSDEFMGDALLCFDEIPRGDDVAIGDLEHIYLDLMKPSDTQSEHLKILDRRGWDPVAKKFVRAERKKMQCN